MALWSDNDTTALASVKDYHEIPGASIRNGGPSGSGTDVVTMNGYFNFIDEQ